MNTQLDGQLDRQRGLKRRLGVRMAAVGALAAVAVLGTLGWSASAVAAPGTNVAGQNPTASTAVIRGAHFSPDTPGVDVYLTAFSGGQTTVWLSNLGYGDVSAYRAVKPGLYAVSMRAHGAPASSPAALSWTVDAKAGSAYTVAGVGMNKNLRGVVLHDELTAPSAGQGRVRVIQAANRAATATVVASPNKVIASNAGFATSTGYASVPAGTWTVTASDSASSAAVAPAHQSVTIASGTVSSLVVLDAANGGLQLRAVRDASGAALTPSGSINAGGGGMAPNAPAGDSGELTWFASVGGAAIVLVAGGVLFVSRRRSAV